MSGLTPTGFEAKTVEQITADLQARQRSTVDATLNGSSTGVLANINASIALELAQVWELAQEIYDAHDPNSAEGLAADHNGALSGVTRLDQSKSTVTLELTLDAGTTVYADSVVSVIGNPAVRFVIVENVSTVAGGVVEAVAQSEAFGPVNAAANSLQQIDSPTSGWSGVTNPLAADVGAFVETDESYRNRRVEEIAAQGGSTTAGIVADLRKLTGVLEVAALENETEDVDANGLPPHSFEIIIHVDGDADPAAVGASIWKNKPAGIEPVGTQHVVVTDSEGFEQDVYYSLPTLVTVNVQYRAETDSTYDAVGPGVKVAISNATQDKDDPAYFGVGKTVYLARLQAAGLRAQGVLNLSIDIARDPATPSSAVPAAPDDKLTMGPRELPAFGTWVPP